MKIMRFVLMGAMVLGAGVSCETATDPGFNAALGARFLKADGKALKDAGGTGEVVNLRGTNAGGWLVQEAWMTATDSPDQKTTRATLAQRFGTAARDQLLKTYEDNFWTAADFDRCKALGLNVLRLPFTFMNLLDDAGNLRADAWTRLDWFVAQAKARDLWVILDLHGAPGSQNGQDHSGDTSGAGLWTSTTNQDKTVWLWEQVAGHFRGEPTVAGYDLLNEPTAGPQGPTGGLTKAMQWDFYSRMYTAVRAVDPDHLIVLESCWEPGNMPNPADRNWANVMYEYHNYCWGNDSNTTAQTAFTDGKVAGVKAAGYNVPTLVGEFMCFNSLDAWNYTLARYNAEGWNWTTWTYKVTGSNNNWGLYNHNPAKVALATDTQAVIQSKWSAVGPATLNQGLAAVVQRYAQAPVVK